MSDEGAQPFDKHSGLKSLNHEQGHALFIVMCVGFVLFMLIGHLLAAHLFQIRAVHLKEQDLRSHVLVQSALSVWLAEQNLTAATGEYELHLEDGVVTFEISAAESGETSLDIILTAYVPDMVDPEAVHSVRVEVEKETGDILSWQDL